MLSDPPLRRVRRRTRPIRTFFHLANTAMMMHQTPSGATTFGYLSAVESAEHGFFGGYLLVSPLGRPVEFHCTAPVRPSRAQEILYGPTLRPYLLGEQIAGTLLSKAQLRPQIILTDQPSVLCHRSQLKCRCSRRFRGRRQPAGPASDIPKSDGDASDVVAAPSPSTVSCFRTRCASCRRVRIGPRLRRSSC